MHCSSVWQNIGKFSLLHLLALCGLTLLPSLQPASWAWLLATYVFSGDLALARCAQVADGVARCGHHGGGAPALVPSHLQGGSAKLAAIITVTLMRD